ncbi:MAG TPA: ABC transporter permease [Polyangia bacterium]|nr:ABC transporter permease [Polyangia bacterium]
MTGLQTIRIAGRALMRNKLRSFLTALGIIIGVGAVIAMVAIGDGAKAMVEQSYAAMGSNLLVIMSGTTTSGGAHGGFGSMPTLTWDDLTAIQREVPAVQYVAPQLRTNAQVITEEQNWSTSVTGTTADYFALRSWPTASGNTFGQSDIDGATKVVVMGQTVVDKLFGPSADPVGQMVRIRNIPFQVVGVLARKGQSPSGQDYDDGVFIPSTTFMTKIQGGLKKFLQGTIMASARSADATAKAQRQITGLLRERHNLPKGTDDDFSIRNLAELASAQQEGTKTLTTLLASIAAVSLLVGGVGIMNIMLVSVTERTREIGLRMAVGARRFDILTQFLVEALTLSSAGGIVGIASGLGVAHQLAAHFNWPLLVRPQIIVIAVGFSAVVGIGFGLYPARKASRLDPIEALRFE